MDGRLAAARRDRASPAGERWHTNVPDDAQDGHEIRIAVGELRYEGVVSDLAGQALANIRVIAYPGETPDGAKPAAYPTAVTDRHGRFVLPCAQETPHFMKFSDDPERPVWSTWESAFAASVFRAAQPPSHHPDPLEIRIARCRNNDFLGLDEKRIQGKVRSAATGEPIAGARVALTALFEGPGGVLELSLLSSHLLSGPRRQLRDDRAGRSDVHGQRLRGVALAGTARGALERHAGHGRGAGFRLAVRV